MKNDFQRIVLHIVQQVIQDRRDSNCSSSITNFTINKTTSDFQLNITNSKTSSRASGINLPPYVITMQLAANSKQITWVHHQLPPNVSETKEKHGVRKLIQKIFRSSASYIIIEVL